MSLLSTVELRYLKMRYAYRLIIDKLRDKSQNFAGLIFVISLRSILKTDPFINIKVFRRKKTIPKPDLDMCNGTFSELLLLPSKEEMTNCRL